MPKKLVLIVLMFMLLLAVSAASAENLCIEDQSGCRVTNEDGQQIYIMFWSEEARAFFMDDLSKPWELVVEKPNTKDGKLTLESPKTPKLTGTACLIYCANLEWGNNQLYAQCAQQTCGVANPPNVPGDWKK